MTDANDKSNSAACVHDVLEGLSQDPAKFRAAADGWANGDVARAIDLSDGPNRCWLTLFEGSAKVSMESEMAAIDQALQTPGKAVALSRPCASLVVKERGHRAVARQGLHRAGPGDAAGRRGLTLAPAARSGRWPRGPDAAAIGQQEASGQGGDARRPMRISRTPRALRRGRQRPRDPSTSMATPRKVSDRITNCRPTGSVGETNCGKKAP